MFYFQKQSKLLNIYDTQTEMWWSTSLSVPGTRSSEKSLFIVLTHSHYIYLNEVLDQFLPNVWYYINSFKKYTSSIWSDNVKRFQLTLLCFNSFISIFFNKSVSLHSLPPLTN